MNLLAIIQLILQFLPSGITLTEDVLAMIQEIETVVGALPQQHQIPVAKLAAKALVTPAVPSLPIPSAASTQA